MYQVDVEDVEQSNYVSERSGDGASKLEEGVYPVVVTKVFTEVRKNGQLQQVLEISPCTKEGDAKSAQTAAAVYLELPLPILVDPAAWAESHEVRIEKNKEYAKKYGKLDMEVGAEKSWKDTEKRLKAYNKNRIVSTYRSLLGIETVPTLTSQLECKVDAGEDEDGKKFFRFVDAKGQEIPYNKVNQGKAAIVKGVLKTVNEVLAEKADFVGTTAYAKIEANEWNGKTTMKVAFLSETPIEPSED